MTGLAERRFTRTYAHRWFAAIAGATVVLAHLLLWLLLRDQNVAAAGRRTARTSRTLTTLVLIPSLPTEPRANAPGLFSHPPRAGVPSPSRRVTTKSDMNSSADASQHQAGTLGPAPADPVATPASAPIELDLTLTPQGMAAIRSPNPALSDDRLQAIRKSLADRLGESLNPGDEMTIEPLGGGRIRVRQGDSCYDMVESKPAQLNPFADLPSMHMVNCGN